MKTQTIKGLFKDKRIQALVAVVLIVATTVGVLWWRQREPKLAKANTQQAVMNFARPTAAESKPGVKPVKTIKLRKNRKPIITTYPK